MSQYPSFTLAVNNPTRSSTKMMNNWLLDFDAETSTLVHDDGEPIRVRLFERLVVGEDVIVIQPDGNRIQMGELRAFALNESGSAVPYSLAPQKRPRQIAL